MKNILAILLFLVLGQKVMAQADIHFSQFYETSILRNPALTGVFADDYKLGAYYRSQWSSITFPYQTTLISAETHASISRRSDDFLSFGILGFNDKAGSLNQQLMSFYPAINYNKSLNPDHNTYLSVGFTAGYIQYSFDPAKATFNNQYMNGLYDPSNPSLENLPAPKMSFWDLGAGVNYNTSLGRDNATTVILGASAYHFTKPNFSYYQYPNQSLNIRWNGNGAIGFEVNDDVNVQLQANYARQGTYNEIMVGGILNWSFASLGAETVFAMGLGAFYRFNDALIPVVKVKYKNFALGVSYDVNVSPLKEASNMQGAYETTLFITGLYPNKNGVLKRTVCPRF